MALREGDIEALRRKRALEGRPIRSTILREGNKQIFYKVKKTGVEVTDEIKVSND